MDVTASDIAMVIRNPRINFDALPAQTKQKILDQAIDSKLLSQKAIKSGVENTKAYKDALKNLKTDLALETWMKEQYKKAKVSDKEAKDFYDKNSDKFVEPAQVKARHILLKTEKEAQDIIKQLKGLKGKALEDKFIKLAKTKSTGPSGANGGELGWFTKKRMVPEFSEAAFALKPGQITTKPVKTQFGYHIIYVEDKKDGGKIPFDKVKDRIKAQLKVNSFQKRVQGIAKQLRKNAKIKKF
jgi:parvulin-like peptidyl-prolyl isomerase